MILFRNYARKKESFNEGVVHSTLDPDGPSVARLHLVPPKPFLFKDPPSLLIVNGTWFLPVGPSWSLVQVHFLKSFKSIVKTNVKLVQQKLT